MIRAPHRQAIAQAQLNQKKKRLTASEVRGSDLVSVFSFQGSRLNVGCQLFLTERFVFLPFFATTDGLGISTRHSG